MNSGSIYWLKEGFLECVSREGLKVLNRDQLAELLLTERDECDSDLDELVASEEVAEFVEIKQEELKPKRWRKDKTYVGLLGTFYAAEEAGRLLRFEVVEDLTVE
jgi:hypothetical protein